MHSIGEKMRIQEPTTKIRMKLDPYYQQQKYSSMTSFWRCKVYADIRRGFLEERVKRQWGCRERQFSTFSLAISWETVEMRPALLYSDMQSVVDFSVIPNCVTLNDLEWLFRVKFCFPRRFVWLPTVRVSKIIA